MDNIFAIGSEHEKLNWNGDDKDEDGDDWTLTLQ